MNIPSNIITLIAGIILTLLSLWYGQNHGLLPIAASSEATQVDNLFNFMMTIATGLFLLIEGVLIYTLIKFRRRKGDTTDGPPLEGNVPLEIVWTAIPTVIVFILAIYSFEVYNAMGGLDPMASHDMGSKKLAHVDDSELVAFNPNGKHVALGLGASPYREQGENPLIVNVNGIQYAWIFTYADTGIVSGELHIPVDRPVQLNINAGDVIHAFWLPEFRIKQDAIPGRDAQLSFTPTRVGKYPIICAELCGAYHGGMKTQLYVETAADYEKWVQQNTFALNQNNPQPVSVNTVIRDGERGLQGGEATSPHSPSETSPSFTVNPQQDLLAAYATEIGVETDTLAQLKH